MKLKDRVAIVTGAGTGIGRAIAERFAREGARVIVNYSRSEGAAAETTAAIRSSGGSALSVKADVSNEREVRAMMDRVQNEFGRLDVLVNNAGWSTRIPHRDLEKLTDEIWDRTLNINLRGPFYCTRAAVPLLRKQAGASIINVASIATTSGVGSSIVYAASKAGLVTITMSLARALAPEIRVNAISPGLVHTHFAGRDDTDPLFEAERAITPMKRLATAEDCANAALFLAADATAITGQTIRVEGGLDTLGVPR